MGAFDTCDGYLRTCLENRQANSDAFEKLRIAVPIVKLKAEQFKQETLNMDCSSRFEKLSQIVRVLQAKLD